MYSEAFVFHLTENSIIYNKFLPETLSLELTLMSYMLKNFLSGCLFLIFFFHTFSGPVVHNIFLASLDNTNL